MNYNNTFDTIKGIMSLEPATQTGRDSTIAQLACPDFFSFFFAGAGYCISAARR
jgi:hypothetical protein